MIIIIIKIIKGWAGENMANKTCGILRGGIPAHASWWKGKQDPNPHTSLVILVDGVTIKTPLAIGEIATQMLLMIK